MGKQRKKKPQAPVRTGFTWIELEKMARDLVHRGLAPAEILDVRRWRQADDE